MSKTEIKIGSDYMDFVYKFHNTLMTQKISLVYEGEVNQNITKIFSAMTEKNLTDSAESTKTTKKLYHVMVECLQNICKHGDDPKTGYPYENGTGAGIVVLGEKDDHYTLTTGNTINNKKIEFIQTSLDEYNALDEEGLKETFKKMMKESVLSEKAGAGLGFIDIIKKTGNKVDFHFEPIDDKVSFFIFSTKVDRN